MRFIREIFNTKYADPAVAIRMTFSSKTSFVLQKALSTREYQIERQTYNLSYIGL